MIDSFLLSWDLFRHAYLAGWLIALLLSLIGVLVVARDQIFIGAAISQASGLGIAVAVYVGTLAAGNPLAGIEPEQLSSIFAVAFSVLAAVATANRGGGGGGERRGESHEAVAGWVFLLSASLSVLLLAHSPHGLEQIQQLASSSLIGATDFDVWRLAGLVAATAALLLRFQRRVLLLVTDPVMADAVGMRTRWWSIATAAWIGVCIGLSMRISGMLYTFGLLVMPALIAKNVCREIRPMFLTSSAAGLGASVAGFILANHFDFPPAQMTVATLAAILPVAWLARRARSRLTG